MDKIYYDLIKNCPTIAAELHLHAELIERTYADPTAIVNRYEIDGKCRMIKAWMIQDSATEFLNVWEWVNQ